MTDRTTLGQEVIEKLAGSFGKEAIDRVSQFSPDFAKMLLDHAFGEVYSRGVLDLKQRELLTLSSLITQGADENQLRFHLSAAINIGFTVKELIEITIHCSLYAGFPRALTALFILQKICAEQNAAI